MHIVDKSIETNIHFFTFQEFFTRIANKFASEQKATLNTIVQDSVKSNNMDPYNIEMDDRIILPTALGDVTATYKIENVKGLGSLEIQDLVASKTKKPKVIYIWHRRIHCLSAL